MAGNPALTQVRCGFETNAGRGDPSTWIDMRIRSEDLGAELPGIEDDSILSSGEQEESLESKIDPGGPLNLNWTPEDHSKILAAFFGKSATPVQSPTGVYTHKLAPDETDVSFASLAVEVSRDLGRPTVFVNAYPSQLTFNIGPRSLLNGAASIVTPRFHFHDAATVVTAPGGPANPELRGFVKYAYLDDVDNEGRVYVKVNSAPSGDNFNVVTKFGLSASYGTTDQAMTAAIWGPNSQDEGLWDEADAALGDIGVPIEILFPAIANIAQNDEWYFDPVRAVWSQSLPEASALNEVYCLVKVDGTTFRTRDLSLTLDRPVTRDEVIGGRFVDDLNFQGQRTVAGQLNRRAIDNSLVDRLLRAESFELQVDAYGTFIAATGARRKLSLIMKNVKPSGRTPSVAGRDAFDEAINFTAHPSDDGTYPNSVTCELVNSIASLA